MSNETDDVTVKFGASIDDLKSKLGEVQGLFKDLTEHFAALAAIVGGGTAFKSFIDEANKVTGQTAGLAKALGVTGDEAAALNTTLDDIGSSADTYTGAFQKFSRQLQNNSETLKSLGVDVDGVRKGTVSGNEAFMQGLAIVQQYKAGQDQNRIAMQLFGRSVADVQVLLKITPELLEEARKKNEELNLNITQESVAASKAYKLAMKDVGDVLTGLEKTIGEALIPVFTKSALQLASIGPALVEGMKAAVDVFVDIWGTLQETVLTVIDVIMIPVKALRDLWVAVFGEDGPGAMQIFKNALAVVSIAFIALRVGFEEVANVIRTGLTYLSAGLTTFAEVTERALHFDFAGAKAAWKDGVDEQNRILQDGMNKAVEIARKGGDDIEKAALKPTQAKDKGTEFAPKSGTKTADIQDKGAQAAASARNALLKASAEADLAVQKAYFSEVQQLLDDAYKQGELSTQAYYENTLQVQLAGLDAELNAKKKELDAAKALEAQATGPKALEARLKAQAQEATLLGAINVLEVKRQETVIANSNAYRDAERDRLNALAQFAAASAKQGSDANVSKEKAQLDQLKALRQISADDAFAIEKKLEDESFAALTASLAAKKAAIIGTESEQAKARQGIQLEEEAASQSHEAKLTQISNNAALEREKYSITAQQGVQSAFSTMVNGILSGTQKMSETFRQFGINIANQFTGLIAQKFTDKLFDATGVNQLIDNMVGVLTNGISKIVNKFVTGETQKTVAETAGSAKRKTIETTSAATTEATTEGTVAVHIAGEEAKVAASVESGAVQDATAISTSATSIASTGTAAIANIAAKAWEAAASVYASIAAIPYVGPFLAPAAAIAAGAVVLGFASRIASSAGGDSQVDQDRLNFVHKDETILPADYAGGLRKLIQQQNLPTSLPKSTTAVSRINSGASPSGDQLTQAQGTMGGKAGDMNVTVTALDSQDVARFFQKNGRALAKSLQNQGRNGVGIKPT